MHLRVPSLLWLPASRASPLPARGLPVPQESRAREGTADKAGRGQSGPARHRSTANGLTERQIKTRG